MSSPAPQAEGTPAGIAQRQFATARKGYDPHEVRAYLAELSGLVERLQRSESEQRVRAEEAEALTEVDAGQLDEKRLIELLGEETARVLEVARAAAADIRRKAEESASRLISEASDQAHRVRTEADERASRVLGEATGEAERVRSEARASADRLVGEATAEAEQLRGEAEDAAARTRREVTDEVNRLRAEAEAAITAQRIELRTEVESLRHEAATELDRRRAEGEALVAEMRREAEEECATLRAAAQEEGRKMVNEAQVVRERMLRDLGRRRRAAREQLERLNAARERLLVAYDVVRRTVDAATGELTVALPEAKVAGEAAMRRAQGEPEPSIEELDDLVAMARIAGLLDPRLEPSILDDDSPEGPPAPGPVPDSGRPDPTSGSAAPGPDLSAPGPPPAGGAPSGGFAAVDRSTSEQLPSGSPRTADDATPPGLLAAADQELASSDRLGSVDGFDPIDVWDEADDEGARVDDLASGARPVEVDEHDDVEVVAVDVTEVVEDDAVAALREIAALDALGDDEDDEPGDAVPGYDVEPGSEPVRWPGMIRPPVAVIDVASAEGPEELDGEEVDEDPIPAEAEQLALTGDDAEVVAEAGPDGLFGGTDEGVAPSAAADAADGARGIAADAADGARGIDDAAADDTLADADRGIAAALADDEAARWRRMEEASLAGRPAPSPRPAGSGSGRSTVDQLFAQLRAERDPDSPVDDESTAPSERGGIALLAEPGTAAAHQGAADDPEAHTARGGRGGEGGEGPDRPAARRHGELPHLLDPPAWQVPETTGSGGTADRATQFGDADAGVDAATADAGAGAPGRAGHDPGPDDDELGDPDGTLGDDAGEDDQAVLRRRDDTLAAIEQGLARRLKRVLADEQNEVLDLLRRTKQADQADLDELLPEAGSHRSQYGDAARDDLDRAAEAGAQQVAGAASFDGSCHELAAGLAQAVVTPLRERIARSLAEAGPDPDELTNRLRSLYREWKAQRINDAVRHFAAAAYARGAYAGVPEGKALRWVVDRTGDLCPDADDNALAGPVPRGAPFPTGDRCPPAHLGCRCLVVPAGQPAAVPVGAPGARGVGLADTGRT